LNQCFKVSLLISCSIPVVYTVDWLSNLIVKWDLPYAKMPSDPSGRAVKEGFAHILHRVIFTAKKYPGVFNPGVV